MIPRRIKIAGIVYDVEERETVLVDNEDKLGACWFRQAKIEVSTKMSKERKEETFIHELLHAILYEAGVPDHEEDLVEKASRVLYQVLKDNKIYFGETRETEQCNTVMNG